jgi:hypothetical protein
MATRSVHLTLSRLLLAALVLAAPGAVDAQTRDPGFTIEQI